MTDRLDIADCITALLHAVDSRDWARVRGCFTDELEADWSSLFGGEAERLRADVLVARWRGLLPGFDSTQHLTGPVLVHDLRVDEASARTAVRAYHYVKEAEGGPLWMVAGHYEMRLRKLSGSWRITAMRLDAAYQSGNIGLPAVATRRAAGKA